MSFGKKKKKSSVNIIPAEKVTIDPIETVSQVDDSRPQLKNGCVIGNNVCRGKVKVCATCSMVYCDKHYNRETHVDSCTYRAKEQLELMNKYGNTKL